MTVYVLHENPDWYPPFERAFISAGVDAREWLVIEGVIDLDAEPVVPVPEIDGEILAVTEAAPVFNIEDSIRETRNTIFAELDATAQPVEPSQKWREALRQPTDPGDLFKDLED